MIEQVVYISIGLFFGASGAWIVSHYAFALGLEDLPNSRSSHTTPTPRGGGIGLVLAFILTAFWAEVSVFYWMPVLALSLLSLLDDISPLSSRSRLIAQLLLTLIMVATAGGPLSAWSLVLIPFWVLFITGTTNFYNFMDGINGIAGLTGVACFGLIVIFSYQLTGVADAVALTLVFACSGFLPFNFPRSKVFMGDVGSVLLGFSFAGLVFHYSADLATFLCLVSFLFLFYADTLTTLYIRSSTGKKLTQAHRSHLYQVLCNEAGMSHWQVSLAYFFIQIFVGITMLVAWRSGLGWQVLLLVLSGSCFIYVGLKIRRHFAVVA